jgi:hypothetical protein
MGLLKTYTTVHFSQIVQHKKTVDTEVFLLEIQPWENYWFSVFWKVGTAMSVKQILSFSEYGHMLV